VAAVATATQVPPDLAGMLALAVLATVAAGAVEVERGRAGASRCACSWPWRYLAVVLDGFSRRIVGCGCSGLQVECRSGCCWLPPSNRRRNPNSSSSSPGPRTAS
jgi:hypothetical protein